MARRRTIHGKISLNRELASLSPFTCLTFSWGIAHCDDWGVISGDPVVFKALVFPLRKESHAAIEKAINELVDLGLVVRYERDGQTLLHYPGWDDHQEGLHKRTRSRTELPLPPGHLLEATGVDPRRPRKVASKEPSETLPEVPGSSGNYPPKGSEGKLSEVKGNEDGTPAPAPVIPPIIPQQPSGRPGIGMNRDGAPMLLTNYARLSQAVRTVYLDHWGQSRCNDFTADAAWALENPGCQPSEQDAIDALSVDETRPGVGQRGDWWIEQLDKAKRKSKSNPNASPLEKDFIKSNGERPTDPTMGQMWDNSLKRYMERHSDDNAA